MKKLELKDRGNPVFYYPVFAKFVGGVKSAILLSLLINNGGEEGWISMTMDVIESEAGLTRTEQETARKKLRESGFVKEKYDGLHRSVHFKVDSDKLLVAIKEQLGRDRRE